jgi:peptidyl-prolyl cis-trans isomerase SurA
MVGHVLACPIPAQAPARQAEAPAPRPHLALLILLLLLLLPLAASAAIIDRIAVSVGNRVVTTLDVDREIRVTAFLDGRKPDFGKASKLATADRLVDQQLIRRELDNSRYPATSAAEIVPLLEQFKSKYFASDAAYKQALADAGITEQDLKDELLWQRTLLSYIEVRFQPTIQVTDQDIHDYFDKTVGPAARAAHPGQTPTLNEYREQIETTLTGQREDRQLDAWLKDARQRNEIVYHAEALE